MHQALSGSSCKQFFPLSGCPSVFFPSSPTSTNISSQSQLRPTPPFGETWPHLATTPSPQQNRYFLLSTPIAPGCHPQPGIPNLCYTWSQAFAEWINKVVSSLTRILFICSLPGSCACTTEQAHNVLLSIWDHPLPYLHLPGLFLLEVTNMQFTDSHQFSHKVKHIGSWILGRVHCPKWGNAREAPNFRIRDNCNQWLEYCIKTCLFHIGIFSACPLILHCLRPCLQPRNPRFYGPLISPLMSHCWSFLVPD